MCWLVSDTTSNCVPMREAIHDIRKKAIEIGCYMSMSSGRGAKGVPKQYMLMIQRDRIRGQRKKRILL